MNDWGDDSFQFNMTLNNFVVTQVLLQSSFITEFCLWWRWYSLWNQRTFFENFNEKIWFMSRKSQVHDTLHECMNGRTFLCLVTKSMIPYKSKNVFNFNHALIQFRRINAFTCLTEYIAKDILVNDYMKFKISFVKRRKLLELKRRFTFDEVVLSMSQFSTLSY